MTFEDFWALYPRHDAKKDARKAWDQLQPTAELQQQMTDALGWQTHREQWLKADGDYIPLAATWLRGERWTDERRHSKLIITPTLQYPWSCPHTPRCPHRVACQIVAARTA